MEKRLVCIVFGLSVCSFIFSGCVTTRNSTNVEMQQMQNRIDFLEEQVKSKDQEIGSIERELRQVKMESWQNQSAGSIVSTERMSKSKSNPAKPKSKDQTKIIRVSGISAKQLQKTLKKTGFYHGSIDGKIGAKTKQAIKAFQKANKLTTDGIVGRGTWAKLKNY